MPMASLAALGRASIISGIWASGVGSSERLNGSQTSLHRASPTNEKKNRSFYRQPHLQRVRPAASCDVRRKQFAQRLMWFGETQELLGDELKVPGLHSQVQRRHSSAEVYCDKSNQPSSILKRTESAVEPTSDSTSLSDSRRSSMGKKQAHFREDVDVIYYDQRERTNSTSHQRHEKLKDEKQSSFNVTERTYRLPCTIHPEGPCNRDPAMDPCKDGEGNFVIKPIFPGKEVEVIKDGERSYQWKLFVPIGTSFIRNRTSVKALSGGRRLIVMAYRMETPESGEQYLHHYVEKLQLPHAIDAYGVRASMDKDGNLKINAPLIDGYKLVELAKLESQESTLEEGSDLEVGGSISPTTPTTPM